MATPRKFDWTNGHVQRETGTDSLHVERDLVLRFPPREYRVRFQIPKHIYDAVGSVEREHIRVECQELFQRMLFVAKIAREPYAERICIEETLRTYIENIYRVFVHVQLKAGNKKWLVPATIQRDVLEEN